MNSCWDALKSTRLYQRFFSPDPLVPSTPSTVYATPLNTPTAATPDDHGQVIHASINSRDVEELKTKMTFKILIAFCGSLSCLLEVYTSNNYDAIHTLKSLLVALGFCLPFIGYFCFGII